jgi:four helix bundle protein
LVAYQRAAELANDLYEAVNRWRKEDFWALGLQLLRATDSIAANIAEAAGRWNVADRRRFLIMARGSLYEAEHWMLQAEARQLLPAGSARRLDTIARPLSGLIKRPTKEP